MDFKKIDINNFDFNPFTKIGKTWMLVTSGDSKNSNTMTASWGGFGVLWGKNVAFTFIRPQRYTKKFIDSNESFSLSFFDDSYKNTLSYLGTVSGKDEDKIQKSGLNICYIDDVPTFKEANLVIICKKLYAQDFKPDCFIKNSLDEKWYGNKDYHTMYISEITDMYIK